MEFAAKWPGVRFRAPVGSSRMQRQDMIKCGAKGKVIPFTDAELFLWNEERSEDGLKLDYHQWEALRDLKTAAVLRALSQEYSS
jgi:hypothetical protein